MKSIRKYLLILAVLCGGGSMLHAQKLMVKVHGAICNPAAQSALETSTMVDTAGNAEQSVIFASLGGGLTFGLDVGYKLSDHFGLTLGFQFLNGRPQEALATNTPANNITAMASTRQGQVTFGGVVSTGTSPVSGFSRFGILLPVFGTTTLELDFQSDIFGVDQSTVTENSGKFSLGFYGGLGVEYQINDLISVSAEMVYNSLRIKTLSAEIVEKIDNSNGEDLLDGLETANIFTDYVDELNENSNNPNFNSDYDLDMPRNELTYTSTYSNVGLRIGVGFSF